MKPKILYVDDEPINLKLLKINFSAKFDVYLAENGYSGLDLLDNQPDIDVVISDMKMPGMDGLEFITMAKAKYPLKKFYILTGFEITDEIKEALDNGLILKYFGKPFRFKEMEKIIIEVIDL